MGNCFGKPSDKNFQGEGRTVGASPATPASKANASIPSGKISAPQSGRTLGKNPQTPGDSASPREAAAKAAEERAKASSGAAKGKLGKQLAEQRGKTQSETLAQTARDNVAARDADAATEARNWN